MQRNSCISVIVIILSLGLIVCKEQAEKSLLKEKWHRAEISNLKFQ
jgi:hypothetical protein